MLTRSCAVRYAALERAYCCRIGFGVDVELDLVADDDAAGLEGHVPLEAPVLAADLGLGAEADARVAPRRGDVPRYSRSSVTGRVTSLIVRSPVSVYSPSPAVLDLGRAEGDRRVASRRRRSRRSAGGRRARPRRCSTPATSMVATTDDSSGFSAIVTVPLVHREAGRAPCVTIRWRAVNDTSVWVVSRAQVPAVGRASGRSVRIRTAAMVCSSGARCPALNVANAMIVNARISEIIARARKFFAGGTIRAWPSETTDATQWLTEPEMQAWRALIERHHRPARDARRRAPGRARPVARRVRGAGAPLGGARALAADDRPRGPAPPLAERHHPPDRRSRYARAGRAPAVPLRPARLERGAHRRGHAPAARRPRPRTCAACARTSSTS